MGGILILKLMKNNTLLIDSHQTERITRFYLQTLLAITFFLLTCLSTLQAQENATYSKPSWYFGVAGGSNFNFYRGSTNMLTTNFTPPATFHNGYGAGLFIAPSIEYYRPNTRLGFIFQGLPERSTRFYRRRYHPLRSCSATSARRQPNPPFSVSSFLRPRRCSCRSTLRTRFG